jgi:hypothetical protein
MVRTRGQAPFITLKTAHTAKTSLSQNHATPPSNTSRVKRHIPINTFRQKKTMAGRKTDPQTNDQDKKLYKESAKDRSS